MPKINILDSSVYNQISAGEVVENPASIVKELVENSIDAGAENIIVMIEDGGIKQINITDDGEGMEEEDLQKAIMPHSTSKISSVNDLLTISTLGFRGEALASISAVSHMEIKSKHIMSDKANFIKAKGGVIIEKGVTALNKGTSITINSLFYNTPARYKFLKSKKNEESQITNLIADIIVANNNVAISYYIDNKLMFNSGGNGLKQAVESIYDITITENLLPVDYNNSPYKVSGFIAKPDTPAIKHNRNFQTIIVNNRIIKDFSLSAIVQNAYGERLMKRTFPLFVLDIILPFDMVDVNVHPNKKEVRFSKDCKINSVVYNAVKDALDKDIAQIKSDYSFLNNRVYDTQKNQEKDIFSPFISPKTPQHHTEIKNNADEIDNDLSQLSFTAPKILNNNNKLKENICSFNEIRQNLEYKIIGQLFDTYILIQYKDKLYIIDQHAAHERILYDNFMKNLKSKPIDTQGIMVPFLYQADQGYDYIMQKKDILFDMGFEIEAFEKNIIKINSVPLQLSNINLDIFFNDLSENLRNEVSDSAEIQNIIAKKACKSAIKGGAPLEDKDIKYVLDSCFKDDTPLQCPHGRPVICKLSKKDIEKMFRRIV